MSVSHLLRIFPILLISSYLPYPSNPLFLILLLIFFLILPVLSPHLPHNSFSIILPILPIFLYSFFIPTFPCPLFYIFLIFLFCLSSPCSLSYPPSSSLSAPFFLFSYLTFSLFSPSFSSSSLLYPPILFLSSSSFSFSINILLSFSFSSPLSLFPPPFPSPRPLHLFSSIFLALPPNFNTQNEHTLDLKTFFALHLNISPFFIIIIVSLTIFFLSQSTTHATFLIREFICITYPGFLSSFHPNSPFF
jgi:hypothetical protein